MKSILALTDVTLQTHDEKVVTDNVRVFVPDAKFKDFPTGQSAYEMISGNDFKVSDEAQTGGVYILAPGQVTGAIWADSAAIREALLGKAVKIGALRKAVK